MEKVKPKAPKFIGPVNTRQKKPSYQKEPNPEGASKTEINTTGTAGSHVRGTNGLGEVSAKSAAMVTSPVLDAGKLGNQAAAFSGPTKKTNGPGNSFQNITLKRKGPGGNSPTKVVQETELTRTPLKKGKGPNNGSPPKNSQGQAVNRESKPGAKPKPKVEVVAAVSSEPKPGLAPVFSKTSGAAPVVKASLPANTTVSSVLNGNKLATKIATVAVTAGLVPPKTPNVNAAGQIIVDRFTPAAGLTRKDNELNEVEKQLNVLNKIVGPLTPKQEIEKKGLERAVGQLNYNIDSLNKALFPSDRIAYNSIKSGASVIGPKNASTASNTPPVISRANNPGASIKPPQLPPKPGSNTPPVISRKNKPALPLPTNNSKKLEPNSKKISNAQQGIDNTNAKIKAIPVDANGKATDPTKQIELETLTKDLEKHTTNLTTEYKKFNVNDQGNLVKQIVSKPNTNTIINQPKTPLEIELEKKIEAMQAEKNIADAALAEKEAAAAAAITTETPVQGPNKKIQKAYRKLRSEHNKETKKSNNNLSEAQRMYQDYQHKKHEYEGRTHKKYKRGMFARVFSLRPEKKINSVQRARIAANERFTNNVKALEIRAKRMAEEENAIATQEAKDKVRSDAISEGIKEKMEEGGLNFNNMSKNEARDLKKEVKEEIKNEKKTVKQMAKNYEKEHKEEKKEKEKQRGKNTRKAKILGMNPNALKKSPNANLPN